MGSRVLFRSLLLTFLVWIAGCTALDRGTGADADAASQRPGPDLEDAAAEAGIGEDAAMDGGPERDADDNDATTGRDDGSIGATPCEEGEDDCDGDGLCESLDDDSRCGACDVQCSAHASCNSELQCACEPGYVASGADCVPGPPPTIVQQPTAPAVTLGQAVSLRVFASGEALRFEWELEAFDGSRQRWVNVGNELAIPSGAQEGRYRVTVSNPGGSVVSEWTVLDYLPKPICTAAELRSIEDAGEAEEFELVCDIDLATNPSGGSSTNWFPPIWSFYGRLYGNGHVIRNFAYAAALDGGDQVGLFRDLDGEVRDLVIEDATLAGQTVGAVAGAMEGWIENVEVRDCALQAGDSAGGIVGSAWKGAHVLHSRVRGGSVSANFAGGVAGRATGVALSHSSVETTQVSAQGGAAGLVALSNGSAIADSYARAAVSSTGWSAGAVGTASDGTTVARVYAAGAVSGSNAGLALSTDGSSSVTHSYWDTTATGHATSAGGGTGVTTATLQAGGGLPNWDGARSWSFVASQYPSLRASAEPVITSVTPSELHRVGEQTLTVTGTDLGGAGARIVPKHEHVCNGDEVATGDTMLACDAVARSRALEWVRVLGPTHRSSRATRLYYPHMPTTGVLPGSGTLTEPFLIATADELAALHAASGHSGRLYAELTADIDLTGRVVTPIEPGDVPIVLDGGGYSISGFTYAAPRGAGVALATREEKALFGSVGGNAAAIRDLRVLGADVRAYRAAVLAGAFTGELQRVVIEGAYVEGEEIAGLSWAIAGDVEDCEVEATLQGVGWSSKAAGISISASWNTRIADTRVELASDAGETAGIVGTYSDTVTLERCGVVLDDHSGTLSGFSQQSSGGLTVVDSYAVGSSSAWRVAGFTSYLRATSSFSNSFAAITSASAGERAGLVVAAAPGAALTATGCYWDSTAMGTAGVGPSSGLSVPDGARTTAQLQSAATYVGWDFATVWMAPSGGYATLR